MFSLALSTMASLFLCIFIGYVGAKKKLLDESAIDKMNVLLLNITFPFMMVGIFNIELSNEIIHVGPQLFVYGVFYQLILTIIALVFTSVVNFEGERKKVVQFSMIFTNTGFVGLPLLSAVMGAKGLLYASILNIPFNMLCFSAGIYLLQPSDENHISLRSILLTPTMCGIWIGIFLLLSQLVVPGTFEVDGEVTRLPAILTHTIDMVGGITSPLAMIIVGASLEQTAILKVFTNVRLHIFSIVKLLVAPLIVYGVLSLIVKDQTSLVIVTIFSGLPTATIGTILAERFGLDYVYASEIVFLTTLYSLITIPILFAVIG